jgi:hypothetical protein
MVDALWKYCPSEWQDWAREYFRRPAPELLRSENPEAKALYRPQVSSDGSGTSLVVFQDASGFDLATSGLDARVRLVGSFPCIVPGAPGLFGAPAFQLLFLEFFDRFARLG